MVELKIDCFEKKYIEKSTLFLLGPFFNMSRKCGICYLKKTRSLQAAPIKTGLLVFSKTKTVYSEVGWESLYKKGEKNHRCDI